MRPRRAVGGRVFGVTVVVLTLVAAGGYGLYLARPSVTRTTTELVTLTTAQPAAQTATTTVTRTSAGTPSNTVTETTTSTATSVSTLAAIHFTDQSGQMIGNALLLIQPTGAGGEYALSVYAPGLEPTVGTGDGYIVEGTQTSGSMIPVPVTGNATTSEFEAGSDGIGQFFALLSKSPYSSFESIQIYYIHGMDASNATLLASASLLMTYH